MFEALQVALSARETVTENLRDIAKSAQDVSTEFVEAAGGSVQFAQSIDMSESQVRDMEDALRSVPDSAEVSQEALGHLQNTAKDLGRQGQHLAVNMDLVEEAIQGLPDDAIAASSSLETLKESMDRSTVSAGEGAVAMHVLAEGVDEAGAASAVAAAEAAMFERELEDIRDDAAQATAAVGAFESVLAGLNISDVGVNFGPFTGSIQTVLTLIATILPLLLGLGTVLGGVATAAIAAGAAVAALFGAGIVSRAQDLAAASEDIQGTAEALSHIMGQVAAAVGEVTAQLQTVETEAFAIGALEGFVTWIGMASDALARAMPMIMEMADTFGQRFLSATPEFFASLTRMLDQIGPEVMGLIIGLLEDMPALINFMTQETEQLLPILGEFGDALVNLLAPLAEIGTGVLSVLLPPLTLLIDFLAGAASVIAGIVVPILEVLGNMLNWLNQFLRPLVDILGAAAAAFIVVAGAVAALANIGAVLSAVMGVLSVVGGALASFLATGLTGAIYAVGAAIWSALGPVGLIIAGITALIVHFGLLDDIIGLVIAGWNMLVGLIQYVINGFIDLSEWLYNTFGVLLAFTGPLGAVITLMANLDGVIQTAVEAWDAFTSAVDDAAEALGGLLSMIPGIDIGKAAPDVDKSVDMSGMKVEDGPGVSSTPGGNGGQTVDQSTNVDIGSIDASGSGESEGRIRRIVREEVRNAERSNRRRESGSPG